LTPLLVALAAGAEIAPGLLAQQLRRFPEERLQARRIGCRGHHQRGEIDNARQVEPEINLLAQFERDRADAFHPLRMRDQRCVGRDALVEKQIADLGLFGGHAHRLADGSGQVLAVAECIERGIGLLPLRLVIERAVLVRGVQMTDDARVAV
jgi:hypothetical protein